MSIVIAVLAFLVILGFLILINTALQQKRNVRAGARLGPSSFFLEVNDGKMEESQSPKE
ncbi:MAG: hypothetical protein AABO58_07620 [Acidobacteriota bacterium]